MPVYLHSSLDLTAGFCRSYLMYHLDTKQLTYNAENIDCLISLSFTAFYLCTLGFSDSFFIFFCLSCLWYPPSSSSSGLPQPSHGCPECKVVWCWLFRFSWCVFFILGMYPSGFPSFCCVLCFLSKYSFYLILCDNTHIIAFSLFYMLTTFKPINSYV